MAHPKISPEQVTQMIAMYAEGKTLAQIGQHFNVSRQRVHQIFKSNDVSSEGKGVRVRVIAKEQQVANAKAARIKSSWGMTVEEYEAHIEQYGTSTLADSPMRRYIEQRRNAKNHGVSWRFTFKTWWALWEASGKWDERGVGKYVLGRVGDATAPMSPATCKVTTVSEIICGDFFSRNR